MSPVSECFSGEGWGGGWVGGVPDWVGGVPGSVAWQAE